MYKTQSRLLEYAVGSREAKNEGAAQARPKRMMGTSHNEFIGSDLGKSRDRDDSEQRR